MSCFPYRSPLPVLLASLHQAAGNSRPQVGAAGTGATAAHLAGRRRGWSVLCPPSLLGGLSTLGVVSAPHGTSWEASGDDDTTQWIGLPGGLGIKASLSQPQTVFVTKPSCTHLPKQDKLSCAHRGLLMWQDDVTVSCA